MQSEKIILYDIPGHAANDVAWSPNTWKVRFVLNLKGLPYRTVWIEYPDIAALYAKLGMGNVDVRNGKPLYGLPVIQDPNAGRCVADSLKIVQYLESNYASTLSPPLLPESTQSFQAMFIDVFIQKVSDPLHWITTPHTTRQLPPRSSDYYRRTRELRYGCSIDELAPVGSSRRITVWNTIRGGFHEFDKWTRATGRSPPFLTGDKPYFVDVVVASYLTWFRRLLGEESQEWREIMEMNDGRWSRLVQALRPYEKVDKEGLDLFLETRKLTGGKCMTSDRAIVPTASTASINAAENFETRKLTNGIHDHVVAGVAAAIQLPHEQAVEA